MGRSIIGTCATAQIALVWKICFSILPTISSTDIFAFEIVEELFIMELFECFILHSVDFSPIEEVFFSIGIQQRLDVSQVNWY